MRLKKILVLYKCLPALLVALAIAGASKTARGAELTAPAPALNKCIGELTHLRLIRQKETEKAKGIPQLTETAEQKLNFRKPMDFDEINNRVEYFLKNPEEFSPTYTTDLRNRMLAG